MWIQRINASSRIYGVKYAEFMHKLALSNIKLDRRALSELCFNEPLSFRAVLEVAKVQSLKRLATIESSAAPSLAPSPTKPVLPSTPPIKKAAPIKGKKSLKADTKRQGISISAQA